MSYRTYVNGFQIFGNNDCPKDWIEFIKSKGIQVNEENCYSGELDNFMEAVLVLEKIILHMNSTREKLKERLGGTIGAKEIKSLFDFTDRPKRIETQSEDETSGYSLLDELFDIVNETYAFIPYAFYEACKDSLKTEDCFTTPNHYYCYRLKEGATIHVEAH